MRYKGLSIIREACSKYAVLKDGKRIVYAASFEKAKGWIDMMLIFRPNELKRM